MSQAIVENIVRHIESLSDEERELLEQRLAEIDEARWQMEAAQARRKAAELGIAQARSTSVR